MFDIFSSKKDREEMGAAQVSPEVQPGPIAPEGEKSASLSYLKVIIFLFIIIYGLISHFHAPLLTYLGEYLVLKQTPQKSDLIVCLAGGNVERGIGAAEAYHKGFAPRILLTMEDPPDGYRLLEERGLHYPESVDLLAALLKDLGVPESAIIVNRQPVTTTFEEAHLVRRVVDNKKYRSLILITSPTHTRRAWLTFKKIFEGTPVRVLVLSTPYSEFNPKDWWMHRKYLREVVIEYQKLIFYTVKYLW
ncbi:MAG: YdcF family protein [Deltaproteobacteria bacterium]|nr:YdcF family protein [Deltaproteobacteria bacterium]